MCECFSEKFLPIISREIWEMVSWGIYAWSNRLNWSSLFSRDDSFSIAHLSFAPTIQPVWQLFECFEEIEIAVFGGHIICKTFCVCSKLYLKVARSVSYSAFDAFSSAQLVKSTLLLFLGLGQLQELIEELTNVFVQVSYNIFVQIWRQK